MSKSIDMGVQEHSHLPAQQATDYRMRSAMVLFRFEQALGEYVTENTPDLAAVPDEVRIAVESRASPTSAASIAQLVQSTYISEILDVAISVSQHAGDQPHLRRLKELVDTLRIYDVRNAVCHPNRPFPACYWHRMAAIATDPAIEHLQLRMVIAAFQAAQEDRITAPPDDWFNASLWEVPNNLPDALDHELTGLIGRSRETTDLLKRLGNTRFPLLAIVGPGGTGKTALCLDALHQSKHDPATLDWCDEIVFVTAKTERLTTHGVEQLTDPIDSINALKDSLLKALGRTNDMPENAQFSGALDVLGSRRVLVCIDNLETLLRDHPDSFDDFYSELPPAWRVLVTSRVPLNSATVLPIDVLSTAAGKHLARDYLTKRGGMRLDETVLDQITGACNCNPLAIRLLVDT